MAAPAGFGGVSRQEVGSEVFVKTQYQHFVNVLTWKLQDVVVPKTHKSPGQLESP